MKPRIQSPLFLCEGCGKEADTLCFLDADEVGPQRIRCPRCRDAELEIARIRRVTASEAEVERRRRKAGDDVRRLTFLVFGLLLGLLGVLYVLHCMGVLR